MSPESRPRCEIPDVYPFTDLQDKFLTRLLEKRYRDFNFSKIEDENSGEFIQESHRLAMEFRESQQKLVRDLYRKDKKHELEQLRNLDFVDVVHFAQNGVLEWEIRAKK